MLAAGERYAGALHDAQVRRQSRSRAAFTRPRAPSAPQPRAQARSGCPYASLIRSIWQRDADWAIGIAWRESRCEPGVRNPSGAEGLFQLLGHGDLMLGCSWSDPACNARAAWRLYEGSGRAPWGG